MFTYGYRIVLWSPIQRATKMPLANFWLSGINLNYFQCVDQQDQPTYEPTSGFITEAI